MADQERRGRGGAFTADQRASGSPRRSRCRVSASRCSAILARASAFSVFSLYQPDHPTNRLAAVVWPGAHLDRGARSDNSSFRDRWGKYGSNSTKPLIALARSPNRETASGPRCRASDASRRCCHRSPQPGGSRQLPQRIPHYSIETAKTRDMARVAQPLETSRILALAELPQGRER